MEMIGIPPPPIPLSIDHMNQPSSNSSTPYVSAASSPQHSRPRPALNFFYSAPTSPRSHASHSLFDDVYDDFSSDHVALLSHRSCFDSSSCYSKVSNNDRDKDHHEQTTTIQYGLMEKDHHTQIKEEEKEEDFEFDFSGQLDMMVRPSLSSADELFDGGIIRPMKLKPPPCQSPVSPKSPKSTISKVKGALNMPHKHRRNVSDFGPDHDPFEAAIRNAKQSHLHSQNECKWRGDINGHTAIKHEDNEVENRGRGRGRDKPMTTANTNININKRGGSNRRKGVSRSLSPLRVSEFALLQHQDQQNSNEPGNSPGLFGLGSSSSTSTKKWKLKDLFLFRSASEGHNKGNQSYSKRWSFRSSNMVSGPGSGSMSGPESGSMSKRRGQASTHETIYSKNRGVAEELKRKTVLPYRHGFLACLGISPVFPQFSYAFPNTPP